MLAATDYIGIAALVSAVFAGLVSVIVALRQTGAKNDIATVKEAVKMSNGRTIGQVIEANDLTGEQHT